MQRLRALSGHLLAPGPAAGAQGEALPPSAPRPEAQKSRPPAGNRWRPSAEEVREIAQRFQQFVTETDQFLQDGAPPGITSFDLLQLTNHVSYVTGKSQIASKVEKAVSAGELAVTELLPGPWHDMPTRGEQVELLQRLEIAVADGSITQLLADLQLRHGTRGLGSNIAVPMLLRHGMGSESQMRVRTRVIVADPVDAERLARTHVRKEANFQGILYDSVISTTDNDHWREQRKHLSEAFLPLSSLAEILPASLARARSCADRLAEAASGGAPVDMNDFLLHEAQAQLQLALLGMPESTMEATNKNARKVFMGHPGENPPCALADTMRQIMETIEADDRIALPSDGCPVRGPLSRAVQTAGLSSTATYGNVLLILFAGHDTTGHTMTWLLFELARRPDLQAELRREVDGFFASLGRRDLEYRDLGSLPFMDRCITETLRLWPAVANGTYRELQFSDTVTGRDGEEVWLPKGTLVNIVNWPRHRNPDLWGADADEFNPRRAFEPWELASVGRAAAAVSPQSERFSPFAHRPRTCLGRNFAQMEMRLIILHLLRRFEFSLAPPYDALVGARLGATSNPGGFRGINRGTMGPMDLEKTGTCTWGERPLNAMKMRVSPRASAGA